MPIPITPLFEGNLFNSIKNYLNTNVVLPYNAYTANGNYPNPLGIMLEKPVDPETKPVLPLLVLFRPVSNAPYIPMGHGDGTGWLPYSYRIGCFPALNLDQKPDPVPEMYLRSYMQQVLGTGLYLPLYDYSTTPATLQETGQIMESRIVVPNAKPEYTMDIERFRFDVVFTLNVPVVSPFG